MENYSFDPVARNIKMMPIGGGQYKPIVSHPILDDRPEFNPIFDRPEFNRPIFDTPKRKQPKLGGFSDTLFTGILDSLGGPRPLPNPNLGGPRPLPNPTWDIDVRRPGNKQISQEILDSLGGPRPLPDPYESGRYIPHEELGSIGGRPRPLPDPNRKPIWYTGTDPISVIDQLKRYKQNPGMPIRNATGDYYNTPTTDVLKLLSTILSARNNRGGV